MCACVCVCVCVCVFVCVCVLMIETWDTNLMTIDIGDSDHVSDYSDFFTL